MEILYGLLSILAFLAGSTGSGIAAYYIFNFVRKYYDENDYKIKNNRVLNNLYLTFFFDKKISVLSVMSLAASISIIFSVLINLFPIQTDESLNALLASIVNQFYYKYLKVYSEEVSLETEEKDEEG